MSKDLTTLCEILGEDNINKLKDGVVDIILDRICKDLKESRYYLIFPDDVQDFVTDCFEEAKRNIRGELVKKYEDEIRRNVAV